MTQENKLKQVIELENAIKDGKDSFVLLKKLNDLESPTTITVETNGN